MTIEEEARQIAVSVLDNWAATHAREPMKRDFEEMAEVGVDCLIDRYTPDEVIALARAILLASV